MGLLDFLKRRKSSQDDRVVEMVGRLEIEPDGNRDSGPCDCCGNATRRVWGYIHQDDAPLAAYFVTWTVGRLDHGAHFDLIIGKWGEASCADDRQAVSLEYRLTENGPAFTVIDAQARDVAMSELVGRALRREEVLKRPIAVSAFAIADAVLLRDSRIDELLGKGHKG
jgi:hypothetical protein